MESMRKELGELLKMDEISSSRQVKFSDAVTLVGCGQAGGAITKQIQERFAKDGMHIDAIFVNTSSEDIRTLGNVSQYDVFKFKGGEGTAQQGKETMKLIEKNEVVFTNFIKKRLNKEVIILVTSTCGGSGSVISTHIADILSDSDKIITMVAVTPANFEGVTMKSNSYKFFSRCMSTGTLGALMAFDNDRGTIESINSEIAEKVFHLLQMTDTSHKNYNIDARELKTALKTAGIMLVGLSEKCEIATLKKSLESKIFELDSDTAYSRLLINATSDTEYLIMEDIQNEYGNYVSAFKGINPNKIVACLAGFKYPIDRLNLVGEAIKQELSEIKERRNKPKQALDLSFDFDFDNQTDTPKKPKKKSLFDDLDCF